VKKFHVHSPLVRKMCKGFKGYLIYIYIVNICSSLSFLVFDVNFFQHMVCIHLFVDWKDYELMFYFSEFFELKKCSYAKSYSSTSLVFVNILLFCGLFALKKISSKIFP
jgi:hypothetical protein